MEELNSGFRDDLRPCSKFVFSGVPPPPPPPPPWRSSFNKSIKYSEIIADATLVLGQPDLTCARTARPYLCSNSQTLLVLEQPDLTCARTARPYLCSDSQTLLVLGQPDLTCAQTARPYLCSDSQTLYAPLCSYSQTYAQRS